MSSKQPRSVRARARILCLKAAIALPTVLAAGAFPALSAAAEGSGWRGELNDDGYVLRNGALTVEVGGRLQYDALNADSDRRDIGTRSGLRRAGLSVAASWNDAVELNASTSFDEDGAALSGLTLAYTGVDAMRVRVGKFGSLVGMERRASSSDTLLMERGLPAALTPRSAWGAAVGYAHGGLSAELAYFTDWQENDVGTRGSDGAGMAARASWRIEGEDGWGVHLGVSGERREPNDGRYRVRARPEAELVDSRLIDTSLLRDVDDRTTWGLEAAVLAGPATLQAEYLTSELSRDAGDATLTGGYVQLGWMLTGEARRYRGRAAAIGGVRPDGRFGAVEFVARYSRTDLDDASVDGGEARVVSAGFNWFVTRNVRLSLDAGRAEGEPNRSGNDERIDFVQGRVQLAL